MVPTKSEFSVKSNDLTKNTDRGRAKVESKNDLFPIPPRKLSPIDSQRGSKERFKTHRKSNSPPRKYNEKTNRMRSAIVKTKGRLSQAHDPHRKTKYDSNSSSQVRNEHEKFKPNKRPNPIKPKTLFSHIDPKIANPLSFYKIPKQKVKIVTATVTSNASSELCTISDKKLVSVGTQTDPCKCSQLTKQKNKNRREAAKRNRDIINHLVGREILQFKD